jgi:hypothetical protein
MAVMLLAPMVQNVSETDRTPHMNALLIGISFPCFQSNRTRNFSEASITKKPANIRGSTCCIPDPVGLNPRFRFYHWEKRAAAGASIRESGQERNLKPLRGEDTCGFVQCGEPARGAVITRAAREIIKKLMAAASEQPPSPSWPKRPTPAQARTRGVVEPRWNPGTLSFLRDR